MKRIYYNASVANSTPVFSRSDYHDTSASSQTFSCKSRCKSFCTHLSIDLGPKLYETCTSTASLTALYQPLFGDLLMPKFRKFSFFGTHGFVNSPSRPPRAAPRHSSTTLVFATELEDDNHGGIPLTHLISSSCISHAFDNAKASCAISSATIINPYWQAISNKGKCQVGLLRIRGLGKKEG